MTPTNSYRLLSYQAPSGPRAGVLVDDTVLDLEQALAAYARNFGDSAPGFTGDSVLGVLQSWEKAHPLLRAIAQEQRAGKLKASGQALSQVKLLAPILYPGALFCATANYVDHIMEMRKVPPPDKATNRPCFFLKTTVHSIIGPGDTAHTSRTSDKVFWEGELGVVIGKAAHYVKKGEAMSYVAGYMVVNDLSDTTDTMIRRKDKYGEWFGHDWFRNKCFDNAAPMGPWITPADEVPNPHDLALKTVVSGQTMQDSSTKNMHFTIDEQIEYLSERITLRPGDVIATGTCKGVGREQGKYLQSGDEVEITIGNLGTLRHRVERDPVQE
jgi:2-keto-4-pentenoate hydratase/2-oxohepta-3-ene-1,7-dioic acid hydratase in catechol pathway